MKNSDVNERIYEVWLNKEYYLFSEDRIKKTIKCIGDAKGKMLDVGCGNGEFTALFESPERELYGVDLVENNVKLAIKKGINAKKCDLNNEKLPFKDKEFDILLCSEVIEHIFDTERFAGELKRVLKDGGALIISVPNVACWYNRGVLLLGKLPFYIESGSTKSFGTLFNGEPMGHVKAFTKKSLIELLEYTGFKIEEVKGSKINLSSHCTKKRHFAGNGIFKFFEHVFCSVPSLASNIIIRASKKG